MPFRVDRPRSLAMLAWLGALACQGGSNASGATSSTGSTGSSVSGQTTIELVGAQGVSARVTSGPPCRAQVDSFELLVGTQPDGTLIAQNGVTRWTTEEAENGTSIRQNDQAVARIHAKQLFDEQGAPLVRVDDSGDVRNGAGQIIRHAKADPETKTVTITRAVNPGQQPTDSLTITGTTDVVLAVMLSARETTAEIRALAACHYLLPGTSPADPRAP